MIFHRTGSGDGKLVFLVLFTLLTLGGPAALAQSTTTPDAGDQGPERGHEWEFWTGAGGDPIGTPKVTLGNSVWTVGARYGWVLTDAHGPSILRGRFEYAVDALPVVMVFQPGGRAYGFGFDPWIMKWNFQTHHRISPYIELGGGALITTREIPVGEQRFNFTPTGAIGVNLLRGKYHWSIDFRYFHISDAELTSFNPGTDTFGFRIGFGSFVHAK
ncbi:MAG TPA: acyloxyacyl hydrolase [Candidatus Acidoferrales bacterium]|nr:acyloxyacyl hydrolase [Candidatus Acidoferrales bacterium]